MTRAFVGKRGDLRVYASPRGVYFAGAQISDIGAQPLPKEEFLASRDLRGASRIFLFGDVWNAPLILALWQMQQRGELRGVVYLAAPRIPPRRALPLKSPWDWLHAMALIPSGASGCGWHRLGQADADTYALVLAAEREESAEALRPLLERHPAWSALAFLGDRIHVPSAAWVLARIVDPRWHFDIETAEVIENIHALLYLRGRGDAIMRMANIIRTPHSAAKVYRRAFQSLHRLLWAWTGVDVLSCDRPLTDVAREIDCQDPRNFLWATARYFDNEPGAAFTFASRMFVNFLCEVWLDRVSARGNIFVPEYFFAKLPATAQAWRQFVAGSS